MPFLRTQARRGTGAPTSPLPLDFDPLRPFVFLTSCQTRPGESSGTDQRPELLMGRAGEETDDSAFMSV